jgi:integrase
VRREPGWCPRTERRPAPAPSITLREYAERWLATRVALSCRERTREIYATRLRRDVYPTLGELPLTALTRQHVLELLAAKGPGRAPAGLRLILIPLRAMLNAAVDDGVITANPALRIGRLLRGLAGREARRPAALTADELARLLAAADRDFQDCADLVYLLAWSGLRIGEACALRWDDLDASGGFIVVQRTAAWTRGRVRITPPKSSKPRRVDLPRALVARLEHRRTLAETEAALAGRELSPWMFPEPAAPQHPLDVRYFTIKRWPRLLRAAGLRYVNPHVLRHSYATQLLQAGTPVAYVKDQLGHSSIAITVDIYGHAIPNANRGAVERLAGVTGGLETAPNSSRIRHEFVTTPENAS